MWIEWGLREQLRDGGRSPLPHRRVPSFVPLILSNLNKLCYTSALQYKKKVVDGGTRLPPQAVGTEQKCKVFSPQEKTG